MQLIILVSKISYSTCVINVEASFAIWKKARNYIEAGDDCDGVYVLSRNVHSLLLFTSQMTIEIVERQATSLY